MPSSLSLSLSLSLSHPPIHLSRVYDDIYVVKKRRPRAVRTAATRAAVPAAASAVKKDDDELKTGADTNPGFNMALAAMVAGSVFMADAVSPEWAEAARSSGRMGGSSFRAPRSGGRMGGQSRAAPNVQAMPQRSMYGGGFGMPMFMPMWSPFGYGYGFGFGGLGFIFQIMIFFWIVNFFLSFLSAMGENNNNNNRNNYDDDDFPPRY